VRARGGAAWRGRASSGGPFGRTRWQGGLPGRAGGARREAGGLWSAGRTGEGRESREGREREKEFEFKFKIFSKIPFET